VAVTEQIVETNEAICEARPVPRARPTSAVPRGVPLADTRMPVTVAESDTLVSRLRAP
jgi:hypothetical protein